MSLVLCALTLFSERCHFDAIKLIYKHLLSRFRFPYGRENRKFGEVWVLTTATSLFETCTYHPPACRSFSPLARALIPSAIKLADFVTEAIFEQRGSSNMCLIWKYATYNLEWAAPVGQNRSRDQGTRLNGDCLLFALQSKLITCARKMARTKKYTIQTAQKSKQKRKKQLAEARKCRKINQKALDADRTIDSSESSPGASTSTSTTCAPVSNADILGERTRSQFKSDCYSSIEASRVDINSTEPTGNDVCASGRGVVDFSKIGAIVSKLCCPQCHNTSLAFRCNSKQQKGLAVFADVYCATCEETVEGTATYLAEKGGQKDYEVNRQAVFGALSCGLGAHSFNNLCESMDLPGLHHKTFHKKANQMYKKTARAGGHCIQWNSAVCEKNTCTTTEPDSDRWLSHQHFSQFWWLLDDKRPHITHWSWMCGRPAHRLVHWCTCHVYVLPSVRVNRQKTQQGEQPREVCCLDCQASPWLWPKLHW